MENEFREKAEALVGQMTIEEAASQLLTKSPAIDRLGIPAYNWWNEGLHGVARAGTATVFPQAIGLAAMFDADSLKEIAEVISTEARAKYNMQSAAGDRDIYKGVSMWSPNINLFRDPRWGRGQECYGEDPYLTSRLGVSFIKGLQGDGKYLRVSACAKHFAVHSGPEEGRHSFNAIVSKKDMVETYLPAFRAAVTEAGVEEVMGAYNRTNGEPCCGSKTLLKDILIDEWGFRGHVVSDCLAIQDFHLNHKVTADAEESAALALKNGCDINCGVVYEHLMSCYEKGMITEEDIRKAAVKVFTSRFKLGVLSDDCEYDKIGYEKVSCSEHKQKSLEAAYRSIVLLKNNGILPLNKEALKTIAVIGPNADSKVVLEGNYNGTADEYITNIEGIRKEMSPSTRLVFSEGCHLYNDRVQPLAEADDRIAEAKAVASMADVVILCLGLDSTIEGEEGDAGNSFAAGDKKNLLFPEPQEKLMREVVSTGTPVILVINSGSAQDVSYADENCAAVLQCWYSGQFGGLALARTLFGSNNPSGRLPVTFYKEGDLPPFEDYSMKNRTYRYFKGDVLYPFGYGLGYSSFEYSDLEVFSDGTDGTFRAEVEVRNTGDTDGEEVTELYICNNAEEMLSNGRNNPYKSLLDPDNQPKWSLCGFVRTALCAGTSKKIGLSIPESAFVTVLEDGSRVVLRGRYTIYAGGHQPDERSRALTGTQCISAEIEIL